MEHKYIDLDLPSGNLWASRNECGYFTFDEAVKNFCGNVPSTEDWKELFANTWHKWDGNRKGLWLYSFVDKSKKLFFHADGYRDQIGNYCMDAKGYYWSDEMYEYDTAFYMQFNKEIIAPKASKGINYGCSIRLIKRK